MYEYNAICTRVVDGDTIDARVDLGFSVWLDCRIRLEGIDAPETRTKNLQEKVQGLETKGYLKTIMDGAGGHFVLRSHGVGKYGRCIGTIYVGGENINQKLLAEGYAKEYEK
jgi:micrococcal nuclease|tara:strand:+ start:411 stop:746 length:336 start_codon:yes stop_codon:yes gene_type:complete